MTNRTRFRLTRHLLDSGSGEARLRRLQAQGRPRAPAAHGGRQGGRGAVLGEQGATLDVRGALAYPPLTAALRDVEALKAGQSLAAAFVADDADQNIPAGVGYVVFSAPTALRTKTLPAGSPSLHNQIIIWHNIGTGHTSFASTTATDSDTYLNGTKGGTATLQRNNALFLLAFAWDSANDEGYWSQRQL